MVAFPVEVWSVLAAVALAAVWALHAVVAAEVRNRQAVHDFRVRVAELRNERLRAMEDDEMLVV